VLEIAGKIRPNIVHFKGELCNIFPFAEDNVLQVPESDKSKTLVFCSFQNSFPA